MAQSCAIAPGGQARIGALGASPGKVGTAFPTRTITKAKNPERIPIRPIRVRSGRSRLADAADYHAVGMADELPRARLPRAAEREGAAGLARHVQRPQAGGAQVLVQHAD